MLEVRNINKVYKTKNGKEVRALDNVSLKFPQKGLVFILGKSGSGKSTLLNMLGGLDKLDSGEIIIKGKSSADFKQADFDSYRNTYLGFIFQEYNILNEFSVGANVALALELQGKKATKEAINDILGRVDLLDYASRKPNQLSGGQKQRVAIARALVKDPEIILADEPTGALDSKTGIQVFDTLKELSKTKLVIVVSHDREFAESYGDRVIELKDGQVISDIEKYLSEASKKNESISVVDNKIIQIEKGYELTIEDVKMINEYLKQNNAIISIDDKSNRDLKKFARIDEFGNKECFKDTNEDNIVIGDESKFKLIKSRLPFKDSFKIGVSSLKTKPVRLVISILLSVVAFTLFGLADTVNSYNKYNATVESLIDSNVTNISFSKNTVDEYNNYNRVLLSDEDIKTISTELNMDFKGVYTPKGYSSIDIYNNLYSQPSWSSINHSSFKGFLEINNDFINSKGFGLIGNIPSSNYEVAISEYMYETFLNYGYVHNSDKYTPDQMKDLGKEGFLNINPYIRISEQEFKIVGIIDTHFDRSHFSVLENASEGIFNYLIKQELDTTIDYGYHGQLFVKEGFIDNYRKEIEREQIAIPLNNFSVYAYSTVTDAINLYASEIYSVKSLGDNNLNYKLIGSQDPLNKNEILVNIKSYLDSSMTYYGNLNDWISYDEWNAPEYVKKYADRSNLHYEMQDSFYSQLLPKATASGWIGGYFTEIDGVFSYQSFSSEEWSNIDEQTKINYLREYVDYYNYYFENDLPTWVTDTNGNYYKTYDELYENYLSYDKFYYELMNEIMDEITTIDNQILPQGYTLYFHNWTYNINEEYDCNIRGFYLPEYSKIDANTLCVSNAIYDEVASDYDNIYSFAIHDMVGQSALKSVVKWSYNNSYNINNHNIHFKLESGPTTLLYDVNGLLEDLSSVFLYIGIGFAVFAALLMTNYIATSISYKKRDIGILRALGAKSSDVFGIFFNEAVVIAIINFILSFAVTITIVFTLNNVLRNNYNLSITILSIGIRQFVLMLLISLFVAFISSLFPVYKIAMKKPIDAIRNA
ncbi:MAG: ATP-binding cassette domain-containing protein [Anaeroplasmataceae bacterium]